MFSNSVEAEYKNIVDNSTWVGTYQELGQECQTFAYTCFEARKNKNRALNRYRDVNPYDHSRIILKRGPVDYINANLVKIARAGRQYILTQGPLAPTVGHFWLMVWEQQSRAIIMLNKVIEKNELKCHWYWPVAVKDVITLEEQHLTVELLSEEDCNYYTIRVFKLVDLESSESREVLHFHYTTWPDFEVPSSPTAFLEFLYKVRSSGVLEPKAGPAVVHCSAGIGRSGTFCLVDSCLLIMEKEGFFSVNVQHILKEMRKYRMGLIQTSDQLRFSYLAILEGIKKLDPKPNEEGEGPSSSMQESVYSNVAEDAEEVEEEEPPPPPPRAESLSIAPARPLPAIPSSASLSILSCTLSSESSSDESVLTPPERTSPASSADDEDDEPALAPAENPETLETLRRRRHRELKERLSVIKKRTHEAERLHALKRLKSEENTENEPRAE